MAVKRKRGAKAQRIDNDEPNVEDAGGESSMTREIQASGAAEVEAATDNSKVDGEDSPQPHAAEPEQFSVSFQDKSIPCERRGGTGKPALIFTHGAGGGLTAAAMKEYAEGFAEKATIVAFKGNMNLPSRVKHFHAVIGNEEFDAALGGRSMGARAAVIAATHEERQTKALVLVSFPLVGGKNNESREQILLDLPEHVDVLFISGTKDAQCDLEHLIQVTKRMKSLTWLVTVNGADHGMGWTPKDAVQGMRRATGVIAAKWLHDRDRARREYSVYWDESTSSMHCGGWVESSQTNRAETDHSAEQEVAVTKKRKTKR